MTLEPVRLIDPGTREANDPGTREANDPETREANDPETREVDPVRLIPDS